MKILVSNVGSTSLKFKLFDMPEERLLCTAKIERVGSISDAIYYYKNDLTGAEVSRDACSVPSYTEGIQMFLASMIDPDIGAIGGIDEIDAVGFKTVLAKGYYGIHELDKTVLRAMNEYLFVAPAHNAPYLEAIDRFSEQIGRAHV